MHLQWNNDIRFLPVTATIIIIMQHQCIFTYHNLGQSYSSCLSSNSVRRSLGGHHNEEVHAYDVVIDLTID